MRLHPVALDHLVLSVADVERSLEFYCGTIIDVFPAARDAPPGRNLDHFCITVAPGDVDAAVASGELEVVEGPVPRYGARGTGRSVYVRDPDGNTVELREYPEAPNP